MFQMRKIVAVSVLVIATLGCAGLGNISSISFSDPMMQNCYLQEVENTKASKAPHRIFGYTLSMIETFDCQGTQFDEVLDAGGLARLSGLRTVLLGGNNIPELDLGILVFLKILDAPSSSIDVVRVNGATNLSVLNIDNNNLTELDISNNDRLTELRLEANALSNLDLSEKTQLFHVDLSDNNFTTINLDATKDVLLYADLQGNPLDNATKAYLQNLRDELQIARPGDDIEIVWDP